MKYLQSLLFLLFALSAQAGRVLTDSIQSNVLGAQVKYNVYVPSGFDNPEKKFPVVYLLHGLSDNHTMWEDRGHVFWVAEDLIRSEEACEMVIIMPCAGGQPVDKVWNGYFNMPGWNYEDFFFQEFMPSIEKKYHCGGSKGQRAIMGLSMGGGGSIIYCQRHPEMFSSCFAMSAWLDNEDFYVGGKDTPKDSKLSYVMASVNEYSALKYLRNITDEQREKMRSIHWFLDVGDDDGLLDLSLDFYALMRKNNIKCELRVRDGVHCWEYWRHSVRMALPFATRNFYKK